jgi:PAS domain S-box-containing protein
VDVQQGPVTPSLDSLGCGIVGIDGAGSLRYVNERLLSWTGHERTELLGRHFDCLFPAELDDVLEKELGAAEQGDLRARLTMLQRRDGTLFPVVILPWYRRDADSGALRCGVVVDLGAIQTAKPVNLPHTAGLRASLARISRELDTLSLLAEGVAPMESILAHPGLAELSPREREVIGYMIRGRRVSTIARLLHISPHTVRNHLKSIFGKLHVKDQSALIEHVQSLTARDA